MLVLPTRNNVKVREMTWGYAGAVDGINSIAPRRFLGLQIREASLVSQGFPDEGRSTCSGPVCLLGWTNGRPPNSSGALQALPTDIDDFLAAMIELTPNTTSTT
jgi:hypothetical protein